MRQGPNHGDRPTAGADGYAPRDRAVDAGGDPAGVSDIRAGNVVAAIGSAADIVQAAQKVGRQGHVVGIEGTTHAAAMLDDAVSAVDNVDIRCGPLEALPLATESVDWVIANDVINRSTDTTTVFAEIARVLKPGGRTRIADVFTDALPAIDPETELAGSSLARAGPEGEYTSGLTTAGMIDVAVGGRYVFDQSELAAMVPADSAETAISSRIVAAAVGAVWRAYVSAHKPERKSCGPCAAGDD